MNRIFALNREGNEIRLGYDPTECLIAGVDLLRKGQATQVIESDTITTENPETGEKETQIVHNTLAWIEDGVLFYSVYRRASSMRYFYRQAYTADEKPVPGTFGYIELNWEIEIDTHHANFIFNGSTYPIAEGVPSVIYGYGYYSTLPLRDFRDGERIARKLGVLA